MSKFVWLEAVLLCASACICRLAKSICENRTIKLSDSFTHAFHPLYLNLRGNLDLSQEGEEWREECRTNTPDSCSRTSHFAPLFETTLNIISLVILCCSVLRPQACKQWHHTIIIPKVCCNSMPLNKIHAARFTFLANTSPPPLAPTTHAWARLCSKRKDFAQLRNLFTLSMS